MKTAILEEMRLSTQPCPVLLVVFNRPDLTRRLVNALREVRPSLIYVAADGPRIGNDEDIKSCGLVRREIQFIDWQCDIRKLYQDENKGCGLTVSRAISSVLREHDRVIVLEDDCIPSPAFLPFCEDLLSRFRDDDRVCMVCGNLPCAFSASPYGYFFSRRYSCWGLGDMEKSLETF